MLRVWGSELCKDQRGCEGFRNDGGCPLVLGPRSSGQLIMPKSHILSPMPQPSDRKIPGFATLCAILRRAGDGFARREPV